jgi:hypothetical protein
MGSGVDLLNFVKIFWLNLIVRADTLELDLRVLEDAKEGECDSVLDDFPTNSEDGLI